MALADAIRSLSEPSQKTVVASSSRVADERLGDDERDWIAAAKRGSVAAFDRIARKYQRSLLRFLQKRMQHEADAEDVCQDALVLAYRKILSYDDRWRFSTWLYTIAVRQAATHRRKMRLVNADDGMAAAVVDSAGSPAVELEHVETRTNLWDVARRKLSPDQFDALWMFYAEQLPMEDVAKVLNRSRLTTKVLLHRARQKLKPFIAQLQEGVAR